MKRRPRAVGRTVTSASRRAAAPVLIKFGGELLEDSASLGRLAEVLTRLSKAVPLVIVHGGGREIDRALARAGIEKRQIDGLRITDAPTLDVVVSILGGLVNTRLVAALTAAGARAVGLTGVDAGMVHVGHTGRHVSTSGAMVDLGLVGDPVGTGRPALLDDLSCRGYLPVVASIGVARDGQLYNVNADSLAAHLAGRLQSPRLVIAGATAGVLDRDGRTIPRLGMADLRTLVTGGGATGGMVAKLAACRDALERGVREVYVADGRDPAGLSAIVRGDSRGPGAGCTRILGEPGPPRRYAERGVRGPRVAAVKAS